MVLHSLNNEVFQLSPEVDFNLILAGIGLSDLQLAHFFCCPFVLERSFLLANYFLLSLEQKNHASAQKNYPS